MKCYHTYILHPGIDIMYVMILQNLYWPGIRKDVHIKVTRCDTCQRTNFSIFKNGKFPDKLAEETPWNKLCVDIIGPYKILSKGKEPIILKYVTMIDPVTGFFETIQCSKKKAMPIYNFV